MDRRLLVLLIVIAVSACGVAAVALLPRQAAAPVTEPSKTMKAMFAASMANRLPADTTPLSPAGKAQVRGKTACGYCWWGIGESCNTAIWNEQEQYVVFALPGEQTTALAKITGGCADGSIAAVATGDLTEDDGFNYISMMTFETGSPDELLKSAPATQPGPVSSR